MSAGATVPVLTDHDTSNTAPTVPAKTFSQSETHIEAFQLQKLARRELAASQQHWEFGEHDRALLARLLARPGLPPELRSLCETMGREGHKAEQGLESEPLFTERYVCVSAQALHAEGGPLPLSTLVSHDFVVVSPGVPSFKGSANAWFEQQGLRRNVVLTVPSFFMAEEYLRRTTLVGFLPSRLLPCHGLVEIPLERDPPGYEVVAAYHPGAAGDPLLNWLLARVRERFAAS